MTAVAHPPFLLDPQLKDWKVLEGDTFSSFFVDLHQKHLHYMLIL